MNLTMILLGDHEHSSLLHVITTSLPRDVLCQWCDASVSFLCIYMPTHLHMHVSLKITVGTQCSKCSATYSFHVTTLLINY